MGGGFSQTKRSCCQKGKSNVFTNEELDEYADVTYFTKGQILKLHMVFEQLVGPLKKLTKTTRVSQDDLLAHKYLKNNPFSDRIVKVFASDENGSFSFDDFVDMMNVFHPNATAVLKGHYAFKIYDFNADENIGGEDIEFITNRLISSDEEEMFVTREEMDVFIEQVFAEGDLYNDKSISYIEFMHLIGKSLKFKKKFSIPL